MNSVQVYIDEMLEAGQLNAIKSLVLGIPHVHNVEVNSAVPHEMMIDFDAHYNIPMSILEKLESRGIHPDIISA